MEVVTSKSKHSGINEAQAFNASGRSQSVNPKPFKASGRSVALSQSVKSQKDEFKINSRSDGKFDSHFHRPPRVDTWGYNKETHKGRELMNKNIANILSIGDEVKIPQWWSGKRIPGGLSA